MKSTAALIWLGIVVAAPRLASAQEIDNIGNAGQVVVGVDRVMGLNFIVDTTEDEDTVAGQTVEQKRTRKLTTIGLAGSYPATVLQLPRLGVDYFVTDGLSIGGSFMYLRASGETENETTVGGTTDSDTTDFEPVHFLLFHPRLGYSFILDDTFAIWPRAGITWTQASTTQTVDTIDINGNPVTYELDITETTLDLTLEANLVISPMEHFAFLVGPFLDFGLSGEEKTESTEPGVADQEADRKLTAYGLQVGLAGYF